MEEHFARLIWDQEPIGSRELSRLCETELGWKRPTTYTVLRKLCEKGIFQNVNGLVTSRISRDEFYAMRGESLVTENFGGSLPAFLAAFTARRPLTESEADEIQAMIDRARRGS